jgi:septum formation inhibitor-activating ATPase MinD
VSFCKSLSLPIVGIVENMSGYVCPRCGEKVDVFKTGGGKALAEEMSVPFLGEIPIDPEIVTSGDIGKPFVAEHTKVLGSKAFAGVVSLILGAGNEMTQSPKHTRRPMT